MKITKNELRQIIL